MKRRNFMTFLAGMVAGFPRPASSTSRPRHIGVLMGVDGADASAQARVAAFREALAGLGWTEGPNLRIDVRWTAGDIQRMRAEAAALVEEAPDAVLTSGTPAIAALRDATTTIPIVFVTYGDPVARGWVASLAQPGGNVTGLANFEASIGSKWLELLREIAPHIARVALLSNPQTEPPSLFIKSIKTTATALGIEALTADVHDDDEISQAISNIGRNGDGGLIALPDVFNTTHRATIIAEAARHRVPAIYSLRFFALAGGLISYGIDNLDVYRRAASYVDRILNGARPADLPVQLPSKFECVINLTTAKALGLVVTPRLRVMANEMIE
ncbi:ABC transporter substrate-binding protein [Bradyrhizobium sp. INPA03-11B]|uniref:ABC transporter substrate-binding protein n=1 Tax=Bradyrhizobium sp. INPA03-11B TaxID=418598 RepID=UPI00338F9B8D